MESREIKAIKGQLAPALKELGVDKAILFGSISRRAGTRKSDIDILIVMKTRERFFKRYDRFEKIYSQFKGRSLDLLIYTPAELDKIAHRPFIKRILTEGQTIYEH
jgi:predicted nucleotidyltransferase